MSQDLPEEWIDRRKVLKPIFNAAKQMDNLKMKTHLSKDKLIIDDHTYSAGPNSNVSEANTVIDTASMCQQVDTVSDTLLFLGSLSPYSNLYKTNLTIDKVKYLCAEQFIQSEKAAMFDDDIAQYKIMQEANPYKIKNLGSKIQNFSLDAWRKHDCAVAHKAVSAKFMQNTTLKTMLLSSGNTLIAESSGDPHWGTGLHLHDNRALDKKHWKNNGGLMSEILHSVHQELHA